MWCQSSCSGTKERGKDSVFKAGCKSVSHSQNLKCCQAKQGCFGIIAINGFSLQFKKKKQSETVSIFTMLSQSSLKDREKTVWLC